MGTACSTKLAVFMSEYLKVHGVVWHSDGIFEIQFDRGEIEFTPGDCLALFAGDSKTSRPYSIASGTCEDRLRFIVRKMDNGIVSSYLSTRAPGEQVKASPPFGWFRPGPRDDHAPFVFIATGTGISPFFAHLRSFPNDPPAQCLYGVRFVQEAVDLDRLRRQCDLRLAVSRESAPGHHHGRVTDLLEEMPVTSDTHYYLCGLDTMIDDVTNWLEKRGTSITNIHRECFFNASHDAATAPMAGDLA